MKKITMMLAFLAFIGMQAVFAQTTITGTVTDNSGAPVPGATVIPEGQPQFGSLTQGDGTYKLDVPAGVETLVVSFIGMETQRVAINGQSVVDFVMQSGDILTDEVVVTALGIKRSEKTLGYSATTVASDELVKSRNTNVVSSLSGKVAGLQVQSSSSDPGAASSITIRGFGSINGSNQPLYVVDGVPLQNSTIDTKGHSISAGGIANIPASDIESMTVLKGAAATALYGSRASNGVILITTKQGAKGKDHSFSLQYNGGMQIRQVSLFPEFQNDFGQGWNGNQTYIENGSWGPRLDGSQQVYGPIWNGQQLIHEYSALENNVKDFFDLGMSMNHNLSLSGISADDKMTYYLSFSNTHDDGIMPSDADTYKRNTLSFRSTYEANDFLKFSSSVNFAKSETDLVGSFQGTSVVDGLYEMARDISIVDMQDLTSPFNTPEAYFTPYGVTNPYWSLENNYNHLDSKQVYGKLQVDVNPIEALTLSYRFGFDYTDYDRKVGEPKIALNDEFIDEDYGYAPSNMNQDGSVYVSYSRSYEINNDFLAAYQNNNIENFTISANAGLNINERNYSRIYGQTDVLTFETDFWDLSNGATKTTLEEWQQKRRLVGLFGDVTLGYDEFLFLNLTARNDWSSTLPVGENSYFYPGATLSFIFTQLLPENDILSFGKLRLAYGKTGNDAKPYYTSTSYEQAYANGYYGRDIAKFSMNGTNSFLADDVAGSLTLKPEMTTEIEVGTNLRFLKGRLGIDAAYYDRKTDDQIFTLPVDPSTGYSFMVTNFGEVQNKGYELLITSTPIKTGTIRWDLDVNFSKNYNKVLSMPESLEGGKVTIYNFAAGNDAVYMYAEEGKAMGTYHTYLPQYVTDTNSEYYGAQIVDEAGQPVLGTEVEDTGLDMNHDWIAGLTSTVSAYGFSLSASFELRYGGTMFSRTKNLMQFTGNGVVTTYNDRNPFIIPNSVKVVDDGAGNLSYEENTVAIKTSDGSYQKYFDSYGYGNGGLAYLVDRTFAKIRNITLTYSLPKSIISSAKLSSVSVSAFVNNPFIWTADDNYYIDPEGSTVGTDLSGSFGELYVNPASRIFGFNLSITY